MFGLSFAMKYQKTFQERTECLLLHCLVDHKTEVSQHFETLQMTPTCTCNKHDSQPHVKEWVEL